jgi:hypothetical protein
MKLALLLVAVPVPEDTQGFPEELLETLPTWFPPVPDGTFVTHAQALMELKTAQVAPELLPIYGEHLGRAVGRSLGGSKDPGSP